MEIFLANHQYQVDSNIHTLLTTTAKGCGGNYTT